MLLFCIILVVVVVVVLLSLTLETKNGSRVQVGLTLQQMINKFYQYLVTSLCLHTRRDYL